jgi:hypothetical protein
VIQAGGEALLSVIHRLIDAVWNEEELSYQCKEAFIGPLHRKGYNID